MQPNTLVKHRKIKDLQKISCCTEVHAFLSVTTENIFLINLQLLTVKLDRCFCWPVFIAWSKPVCYLCAVLKYNMTKLKIWWSNINIISNIIPVKQPPNKQHFPRVLRDLIKYSTTIRAEKSAGEMKEKLHNDMSHVSFNGYEKTPSTCTSVRSKC